MKITIENTTRMVSLEGVDCRVWEGTTDRGIKVYCLIPRIAAHEDEDQAQFRNDLQEQKPPTDMATQVFPMRMVL